MAINVSDFVGRASGDNTDPARFVVPAGVGYYNMMTLRSTEAITTDSGSIPCPLLTVPGMLYTPTLSDTNDLEYYDASNNLDWAVSCTDVKALATNACGYAIDEANSDIIGIVTSGSTDRDITYYSIKSSTGTVTAASTQTAALTTGEASALQTAIDTDGIFVDYDTTNLDVYYIESSDVKRIRVTKSTGAVAVSSLGFQAGDQTTFYPDKISYVSADEKTVALFETQSTSLNLHIHICHDSTTTGQFQFASVRFHPAKLGEFGAYADDGPNTINVFRTGNYCYMGRYEKNSSMQFIGNRCYARADMDAWLLSLMRSV